ncbi:hypothetical protein VTH06DRAFT_7246 [Thermothelomyces fergusii]
MADPSTTQTAGSEGAKLSNVDLEKGAHEPNSDTEAATVVPESDSVAAKGESDSSGEKGQTEPEKDPNIVTWDGPDDPMNPMNWTMRKKWTNIAVLATMTFITPLGSSMFAPGIPRLVQEFGVESSTTKTFVMSVYILGFAFGPLVIAPLSEIYGRSPLYNAGTALFTVFSICAAVSKNIGMLMAFRFLMGVAGCVPITIGSGSIADMMPVEMRGRAMAAWALGPLLGPCIGPVAGGFLIRAAGWRWVYWLIAIVAGIITIFAIFTLKESYAPVILERKTARLRKQTGNPHLRSALAGKVTTPIEKFKRAILRPMRLLCLTPIVTLMSLYVAITYGILYLLFTTFGLVFPEHYHFGEAESGLVFIPSAIGMTIGINVFGAVSDRLVKSKLNNGQRHKPEIRIAPFFTLPSGILIPAGLFIYGWTIQYHVHWIVPMVGVLIFAFGLMGIMMCVQNYLLDVYPHAAASVTAAVAVLRSLAGALLPLCAVDMYEKLGMGWGNSLLGFIALGLVPIPLLFYIFGPRLVKKFPVNF